MNMDNQRLVEIQQLKTGYKHKMAEAESMFEMFRYQSKIDELEVEEIEILKRCDVIL